MGCLQDKYYIRSDADWDMKGPFRLASTILMPRLDSKLGFGTGSVKEAILNASEKASL